MDWKNLGFGYVTTNYNVRSNFANGAWSDLEITQDEYIKLHMSSSCLHYGQESFEGLKAYRGQDGKIRLFRIIENAKRMIRSAQYLQMQPPSVEMFTEAVKKVVELNKEFVPPYDSGSTLYIRPLLIGHGEQLGVKPANQYMFLVFCSPVGPYFKEGFKPVSVVIDRDHDRAAPLGTGHAKVGGNYAASLISIQQAQQQGFSTILYLDSKEKKYIDECGPANFFAIQGNRYITPKSQSILPSITNDSLMILAKDSGLSVERRPVEVSELESFEEVGECGTAAVITPIGFITDPECNKVYRYGNGKEAGKISTMLYEKLKGIQYGDIPDKFGWITIVE